MAKESHRSLLLDCWKHSNKQTKVTEEIKKWHALFCIVVVFLFTSWTDRAKCRPIPTKVLREPANHRRLMLTQRTPSRKSISLQGRCMIGSACSAVQYGFYDRLVELTDADPSVPVTPDAEGITLLHWAALNNRLEVAKYLISKGAEVDAVGGVLQSTPLHWAIREGKVDMVVLLISYNAQISIVDHEGTLILHSSQYLTSSFSCLSVRFCASPSCEYIRIYAHRRVSDRQRARSEHAWPLRHHSANACSLQYQKVSIHSYTRLIFIVFCVSVDVILLSYWFGKDLHARVWCDRREQCWSV